MNTQRRLVTVLCGMAVVLLLRQWPAAAPARALAIVATSTAAPNAPGPQATATPTRTPTPINIGNFIWHDLNGDGVQTGGEPGVGGVTVQLWNSTKTELLASTTSNSSGSYLLVAPLPGDYRIRVLAPPGASFALKGQGAATLDSDINRVGSDTGFTDVVTLASNLISTTTIDAGLLNVQPSPTPAETATPSTAQLYLPLAQR